MCVSQRTLSGMCTGERESLWILLKDSSYYVVLYCGKLCHSLLRVCESIDIHTLHSAVTEDIFCVMLFYSPEFQFHFSSLKFLKV